MSFSEIHVRVIPSDTIKSDKRVLRVEGDGTRHYRVFDTGNEDFNFLALIQAMVEHHMCNRVGVTQEAVDGFDTLFLRAKSEGVSGIEDSPEQCSLAPYYSQRQKGSHIAQQVAQHMGLDWEEFKSAMKAMP